MFRSACPLIIPAKALTHIHQHRMAKHKSASTDHCDVDEGNEVLEQGEREETGEQTEKWEEGKITAVRLR